MGTGEKKSRRELQRVLNHFALHEGEMVYPLRDHPDARDMVVEFAKPLDGLFDTLTTRYSVAIFAWNLSLVDESERSGYTDEFLTPLLGDNEEGKEVISELISALTERRLDLYAEENFLILPSESGDVESHEVSLEESPEDSSDDEDDDDYEDEMSDE